MWRTPTLALLVGVGFTQANDGWTTSAAGCPDTGYEDRADRAWSRTAATCADLSRRRTSWGAALRSAIIYEVRGKPALARAVLSPFEAMGDPKVLYTLAWADSQLGNPKVALEEYRRAFAAAARDTDIRVRGNAATLFVYELYRDSDYEEAVRVSDGLLRTSAGVLPLLYERDARLNLARSLDAMGDAPAAAAELQRLRGILGATPMNSLELLEDANLHVERGQLRSADELLVEAEAAAQHEAMRSYEASAVIARARIAVKETDWERVRALLTRTEALKGALGHDGQRDLAFLQALAARADGRLEESRALLEEVRGLSPPPNELWRVEYESGLTLKALGRLDSARKAFEESISEVELQRKELVDPSFQAALRGSRERPYDALFEMFAEAQDGERALSTLQRSLASRFDDDVDKAATGSVLEASAALEQSSARRTLAEISQQLPTRPASASDQDAQFIAFVTTDTHSWALIHSGGRALVVTVELPPAELCSLMQKFGEDFDDQAAARLGNVLFPAPTLERLGPRFAIILPPCARSFPVAAVRIGDGRLVDRAVVSVAPDVSTVTAPGKQASGAPARPSLVLADAREDLPSAREEAEFTGRLTGASVRLSELASGATLEQSGGRLLHFATHTVVDVSGPALVLADGNLSIADILRRRLHADLVVLASCHSGSGLESTAAETLSTAFLRAGSSAVLATLTSVEDRFASKVVRAFYEQGGLDDPAGALARVQRKLAHTEPPSRWSAFFVAGSPEPVTHAATALQRARSISGG
jgi:tetratricopeptide (TPR) repeat protein